MPRLRAELARVVSFAIAVFSLVPTVAPFLGRAVLEVAGWRMYFAVFGCAGLAVLFWLIARMPETLAPADRVALSWTGLAQAGLRVARNRRGMFFAIALGIASGPFIAWLNLSQAVLEFEMVLGALYPAAFAVLAVALGLASFLNGLIVRRFGATRTTHTVLAVQTLLAMAFLVVAGGQPLPPVAGYGFLALVLFGFGMLVSNLNALALETLAADRGIGASLLSAVTTVVSVPVSISITFAYDGRVATLVAAFGVAAALGLGLVRLAARQPRGIVA